jgi:hypothetical protein
VRQRVGEVTADGDGVRLIAEHHAGIETRLLAVDHREDLVLLRVTNKAVGGLAVKGTEVCFAIDDRGCDAVSFTTGSWVSRYRHRAPGGMAVRERCVRRFREQGLGHCHSSS